MSATLCSSKPRWEGSYVTNLPGGRGPSAGWTAPEQRRHMKVEGIGLINPRLRRWRLLGGLSGRFQGRLG
jgi:hypothetical protein